MKNRWEMEENQRSKYVFHISCLSEKNCQEPLIVFCEVSHPCCGVSKSAKGVSSPLDPGAMDRRGSGVYAVT